jgi:hypothetical protein
MSWVVVTFTTSPCPEDESMRCPMDATGPFATNADARQFAATLPEWTQPHMLILQDPW